MLFAKLSLKIFDEVRAKSLTGIYLVFLTGLAYGWWYFDPLVVLSILAGTYLLLNQKDLLAGVAIALGTLTKWIPLLLMSVAWRFRPPRHALRVTIIASMLIIVVLAGLYFLSPDFTLASLRSQTSKWSWETVWALLDGNLITGNFGPEWQRFDPKTAEQSLGNPPKLPPSLTIVPFLIIGLWSFTRVRLKDDRVAISFLGLTLCLFLLWSPGWSPQWILYLIPITLLAIDSPRSIIFCINLVFVSLLEWPILLSRGRFDLLWAPVILRTLILLVLSLEFGRTALKPLGLRVRGGVV
ncbi:MAG: DUF2029 domain-containing protein [Anaerolineales bacterium]|nr:DUF2029 domain-containing protein [Anaerolineales bacterium]